MCMFSPGFLARDAIHNEEPFHFTRDLPANFAERKLAAHIRGRGHAVQSHASDVCGSHARLGRRRSDSTLVIGTSALVPDDYGRIARDDCKRRNIAGNYGAGTYIRSLAD